MRHGLNLSKLNLDRRLLWLLGLALCVVAGEVGLRAWEIHQKLSTELASVRSRAQLLRSSADQVDWPQQTKALEAMRAELLSKLWHAPSEAQAQARMRDWVGSALRSSGLNRFTVNLLPPISPSRLVEAAAGPGSPTAEIKLAGTSSERALRVRASASFELAPGTLENALLALERSGQLANVDNISVSRRSRRVELALSVPVIVQAAPDTPSEPASAAKP